MQNMHTTMFGKWKIYHRFSVGKNRRDSFRQASLWFVGQKGSLVEIGQTWWLSKSSCVRCQFPEGLCLILGRGVTDGKLSKICLCTSSLFYTPSNTPCGFTIKCRNGLDWIDVYGVGLKKMVFLHSHWYLQNSWAALLVTVIYVWYLSLIPF